MVVMPAEKLKTTDLNCYFGQVHSVKSLTLSVAEHEILGVIGPANSGKTTFLRSINRMNEFDTSYKQKGVILFNGRALNELSPEDLRKKIGMVFAMPLSLPLTVYDNIAYAPRRHGVRKKPELDLIVEKALVAASLWDEVKDRLKTSALKLSGGQQQRLCIARSLAVEPEVILFDEPCSGLDPVSTAKVEQTMMELKRKYTIVLVTNNVKQAARVSTRVAFFLMGELVELDSVETIFVSPKDKRTEDYVTGRFG